jgi:opacity protein-like surface antigen
MTPPGGGYADAASKWNFAWAAHAGVAYRVTPALTLELAYRYVDLGKGITGDIIQYDGTNSVVNPMEFKNITSHDVKLGVRWMLGEPEPVYAPPPPLVRKG